MFIKENHDVQALLMDAYLCDKKLGRYLEKNGFPVLSKTEDGEFFYFADTILLQKQLQKLPFWLKLFK